MSFIWSAESLRSDMKSVSFEHCPCGWPTLCFYTDLIDLRPEAGSSSQNPSQEVAAGQCWAQMFVHERHLREAKARSVLVQEGSLVGKLQFRT